MNKKKKLQYMKARMKQHLTPSQLVKGWRTTRTIHLFNAGGKTYNGIFKKRKLQTNTYSIISFI